LLNLLTARRLREELCEELFNQFWEDSTQLTEKWSCYLAEDERSLDDFVSLREVEGAIDLICSEAFFEDMWRVAEKKPKEKWKKSKLAAAVADSSSQEAQEEEMEQVSSEECHQPQPDVPSERIQAASSELETAAADSSPMEARDEDEEEFQRLWADLDEVVERSSSAECHRPQEEIPSEETLASSSELADAEPSSEMTEEEYEEGLKRLFADLEEIVKGNYSKERHQPQQPSEEIQASSCEGVAPAPHSATRGMSAAPSAKSKASDPAPPTSQATRRRSHSRKSKPADPAPSTEQATGGRSPASSSKSKAADAASSTEQATRGKSPTPSTKSKASDSAPPTSQATRGRSPSRKSPSRKCGFCSINRTNDRREVSFFFPEVQD
jgi:hypothetical protein